MYCLSHKLYDQEIMVRFQAGDRQISLAHSVKTGCFTSTIFFHGLYGNCKMPGGFELSILLSTLLYGFMARCLIKQQATIYLYLFEYIDLLIYGSLYDAIHYNILTAYICMQYSFKYLVCINKLFQLHSLWYK